MLSAVTPMPFTGAGLDRATDDRRRDPDWLAAQRAHPRARAVVADPSGLALDGDRLKLTPYRGEEPALLLGLDADGPLFAVDAGPPPGPPPAAILGVDALREAGARLAPAEGGLLAYVAALVNWHRRHPRCACCGAATTITEGGLLRICPACDAEHHPRTDPVVITLVIDGTERVLLGRNVRWPARRYSALAGFVEPGESLEEAVAREVAEESGIEVGAMRYAASQPWPFPASLMLGFFADYRAGEPRPLEGEIEDVRWYSRADILAAIHEDPGAPLDVPPRFAIARHLIDTWAGVTAGPAA
jgi:NAD+ diphosphatase